MYLMANLQLQNTSFPNVSTCVIPIPYMCNTARVLMQYSRVAEVRFSSVLPPLRENLELDLNLRGHLVQNREPELQNWFYKVQSMV